MEGAAAAIEKLRIFDRKSSDYAEKIKQKRYRIECLRKELIDRELRLSSVQSRCLNVNTCQERIPVKNADHSKVNHLKSQLSLLEKASKAKFDGLTSQVFIQSGKKKKKIPLHESDAVIAAVWTSTNHKD